MYCRCVDPLPDPEGDCCLLCGGVVQTPKEVGTRGVDGTDTIH